MKIENELERLLLLQQQGLESGQDLHQVDPTKFSEILGNQLASQAITDDSKSQLLQSLADPTRLLNIGVANMAGLDAETDQDYEDTLMSMLSSYDNMLNGMDSYASMLSTGGNADLRAAWNMLNSLDSQVGALRSTLQGFGGNAEGLDGLVSEMEVLIATEQFKLNRGDYL